MPQSSEMLPMTGQRLVLSVAQIVILAVMYGTQLILLIIFVALQRRWTPARLPRARIMLVIALVLMLILSGVPVVILSIFVSSQGKIVAGDLEGDQTGFENLWARYFVIVSATVYINSFLGDFVMYWRVASLWKSGCAMVVPTLMLSCTAVSDVVLIACYLVDGNDQTGKCNSVRIVGYALTVCTNVTITISLWYYTWLHKKAVREYISAGSHSAYSERILVIMVESGVLYTVIAILFGTFTIITNSNVKDVSFAWLCAKGVIEALTLGLVGLYPISLIVVIFLQKSVWDPNGAIVSQERRSRNSPI